MASARIGVQHARRVEQRRHDERRRGMAGTGLVLHHPPHHCSPQLGGKEGRRVLVHRAERELPPVRGLEAQRPSLLSTAALGGTEASRHRVEVEHLDVYRRRPEIAVVVAKEEAVQPPASYPGPGTRTPSGSRGGLDEHDGDADRQCKDSPHGLPLI